MKYFGHRGAAGLMAENTLASIQEALNYAVDGIEIDVHCCASGEVVVLHDDTLDRTTNGLGEVSTYTLKEIREFSTIEGYRIPTLTEVLDCIDARCVLNIELKGAATAIPVLQLLNTYITTTSWTWDHFILSSFDHEQLYTVKAQTSDCKLGVLVERDLDAALPVARDLGAFSIHPPIASLTENAVHMAQTEGFAVYVWTVNTKSMLEKAEIWGVDAVITDYPNYKEMNPH